MSHLHFDSHFLPFITGAIATAFLGGWHCAGMCGGIAALASQPRALFLYQVGRLASYLMLGVTFAFFGEQVTSWIPKEQKILVTLSLGALSYWIMVSSWKLSFPKRVQILLWKAIPRGSSTKRHFFLGLFNGLLPCGWLYAFLIVAAGLADPLRALLLMFCLWLGSLPWLVSFSLLGEQIRKFSSFSPWIRRILLFGVLISLLAHNLSQGHSHF
ncbi:MAG: sulfite exporter TauE/SafE family protein [Pseudobdellovibrionaceae bacterium]